MINYVENGVKMSEHDDQKQCSGKPKYFNRVDISCCIDGIAKLREYALNVIKKYPEAMSWKDIPASEFLDAIQRHYNEINYRGLEAVDPEFPESFHLHAIQWNCMVLEMKRRGRERVLHSDMFSADNNVPSISIDEYVGR